MEWWQAIVLGLVEGITEYLPVSSTGHLILASALMKLDTGPARDALGDYEIVIQGGAILAVLGLYWPRVVQMLRGIIGRDPVGLRLVINLLIAFVPAAVLGLIVHDRVKAHLFHAGPVLGAVLIGGLYMIVVDFWQKGRLSPRPPEPALKGLDELTPAGALLIGLLQCVSLWPGTSRSMTTITGALFAGLRPTAAAEFSFLLGLPTLGAATLYSLYEDIRRARATNAPDLFHALGPVTTLIGLVVAAASAALAIKWLVGFLNRRGLTPFGLYRIALFMVLASLIWAGVVTIAPG